MLLTKVWLVLAQLVTVRGEEAGRTDLVRSRIGLAVEAGGFLIECGRGLSDDGVVSAVGYRKGNDFVGLPPAVVQRVTIYATGVATSSQQTEGAKALIEYLTRPEHPPLLGRFDE